MEDQPALVDNKARNTSYNYLVWVLAIIVIGLLSILLEYLSSGTINLQGSLLFMAVGMLGLGLVAGCWWAVQATEQSVLPVRLVSLILIAALIRLGAGVLWYQTLPVIGHGSPPELEGYVMADAYQRDQAAWDLSQSEKPLWNAFMNRRTVDQYGGLLFISALLYRYLGGNTHQSLQMLLVTSSFSALAVLFTWVLARRIWNQKIAWIAAGILVLIPEAVLLGSSQMREAFTITLTVMAFYGLLVYYQDHSWQGLVWILAAILLFLPFSPPFAILLLIILALTASLIFLPGARPISTRNRLVPQKYIWIAIITMVALVLLGVWFTLGQFTPEKINDPLGVLGWWIKKSADLQSHRTESASGIIQAIFDRTPEWSHTPLLVGYGIVQPLLPATLIDTSEAPIWQAIMIWRSLGWTFTLVLLFYATWRMWQVNTNTIIRVLVILIWVVILIASFRGGGDQWDNPRYRAPFIGLQVAIAAWAWIEYRKSNDRTLKYILWGVVLTVLWLIPWYMYRKVNLHWPIEDLFKTLGLAAATIILLIIFDRAGLKRPNR